jgi:hypothetical protein
MVSCDQKQPHSNNALQIPTSGSSHTQQAMRSIDKIFLDDEIPDIRINFDLSDTLDTYEGTETIYFKNGFDFDLKKAGFFLLPRITGGSLDIQQAWLDDNPVVFNIENAVLQLTFNQSIQPRQQFKITLKFKGSIPKRLNPPGIFLSDKGTVCLGGFYPELIPFNKSGGFDPVYPAKYGDPILSPLAQYTVSFRAPKNMHFASSGKIEKGGIKKGRQSFFAISGPVRDFFLAGSFHWKQMSFNKKGILINSYYPEKNMYQGINAFYYSADALKIFEKSFGTYPYNEFDVISAPLDNYAVGMEYPGIIVLNDKLYEPDGMFHGFSADYVLEITIAHEIAHQWFYGLIGSDPVREPWIDESITQYATWLYFKTNRGNGPADLFYSSLESRWSRIRSRPLPISLSVNDYSRREYSAIVYGRGPLFFFELIRVFGQSAFDRYLHDYITTFKWKTVTTNDVRQLITKHFGKKGDDLFFRWILKPEKDN